MVFVWSNWIWFSWKKSDTKEFFHIWKNESFSIFCFSFVAGKIFHDFSRTYNRSTHWWENDCSNLWELSSFENYLLNNNDDIWKWSKKNSSGAKNNWFVVFFKLMELIFFVKWKADSTFSKVFLMIEKSWSEKKKFFKKNLESQKK